MVVPLLCLFLLRCVVPCRHVAWMFIHLPETEYQNHRCDHGILPDRGMSSGDNPIICEAKQCPE